MKKKKNLKEKNKKNLKVYNKKFIIILSFIILLAVLLFIIHKIRANYEAFLDINMKESNIKLTYSPGNHNEIEIYVNNKAKLEHTFSNNKDVKYKYVIEDKNIIDIVDDEIIAKNTGSTSIYLKTFDGIKSNIINIDVLKKDYDYDD